MADDTVEAARQRLKDRVIDRVIASTRKQPTVDELIDALIATVRADQWQRIYDAIERGAAKPRDEKE